MSIQNNKALQVNSSSVRFAMKCKQRNYRILTNKELKEDDLGNFHRLEKKIKCPSVKGIHHGFKWRVCSELDN